MIQTLRPASLEDLSWLQRFAARIAKQDPEDLAQEVALAASGAEPVVGRAWLATVARNRLRMRHRSDAARRAREAAYQTATSEHIAEEARTDRLEVLHALVEELEALEDNDRAIVLGRFFDGRSATSLGEELGMPAATVRTRLRRALARLRRALDERFEGQRVVWTAAVLSPGSVGQASAGVGATVAWLGINKILVALMATIVGSVVLWLGLRPPAVRGDGAEPIPVDARETPSATQATNPMSGAERRWNARRNRIVEARDREPATDADRGADPPQAPAGIETAVDGALASQSQAFLDCAEDLGIPVTGAIVLRSQILGAPDVGTVYVSIDIVGEAENRPEMVECVREHMYGYLGARPAESFDVVRTVTTLGRRPEDLDADAWARRIFDTVVTAHLAEVDACADEVTETGALSLKMSFAQDIVASEVEVAGAPLEVAACVADEARAWMFPRRFLADRTLSRTLAVRSRDE